MAASEVAFLQAEGVLRGWNMGGGTAQSYYEQGVTLSMEQNTCSVGQLFELMQRATRLRLLILYVLVTIFLPVLQT